MYSKADMSTVHTKINLAIYANAVDVEPMKNKLKILKYTHMLDRVFVVQI